MEALLDPAAREEAMARVQANGGANSLKLEVGSIVKWIAHFECDSPGWVPQSIEDCLKDSMSLNFRIVKTERKTLPKTVLGDLTQLLYSRCIQPTQGSYVKLRASQLKLIAPFHFGNTLITNNRVQFGKHTQGELSDVITLTSFLIAMTSDFLKSSRNDGSILIPFVTSELKRYAPDRTDPASLSIDNLVETLRNPIVLPCGVHVTMSMETSSSSSVERF